MATSARRRSARTAPACPVRRPVTIAEARRPAAEPGRDRGRAAGPGVVRSPPLQDRDAVDRPVQHHVPAGGKGPQRRGREGRRAPTPAASGTSSGHVARSRTRASPNRVAPPTARARTSGRDVLRPQDAEGGRRPSRGPPAPSRATGHGRSCPPVTPRAAVSPGRSAAETRTRRGCAPDPASAAASFAREIVRSVDQKPVTGTRGTSTGAAVGIEVAVGVGAWPWLGSALGERRRARDHGRRCIHRRRR